MDDVFRKAARSSIALWALDEDPDDLIQDLWVWYLERPTTRLKMEGLNEGEAVKTARMACEQFLTERVLAGNTFHGRNLYSSDAIRESLHGLSSNIYLREVLPIAREALGRRNPEQAEAIRCRYEDKLVPVRGSAGEAVLKRAVKSLTEEINLIHLTSDKEGRGSKQEIHPGQRRTSGGHSDPTGDLALALIYHGDDEIELVDREQNPTGSTTTIRAEFYQC